MRSQEKEESLSFRVSFPCVLISLHLTPNPSRSLMDFLNRPEDVGISQVSESFPSWKSLIFNTPSPYESPTGYASCIVGLVYRSLQKKSEEYQIFSLVQFLCVNLYEPPIYTFDDFPSTFSAGTQCHTYHYARVNGNGNQFIIYSKNTVLALPLLMVGMR